MAPLDERFQNDATFQSLLVSQRELLSKLNHEKQMRQQQQEQEQTNHMCAKRMSFGNDSIGFQTFRSDNVVFSKRLSIGIGNDSFVLPDSSFDSDNYSDAFFGFESGKKRTKEELLESSGCANKRRRTTLSFLDYLFEKNANEGQEGDDNPSTMHKNRVEYNDSDDEDFGIVVEDVSDSDDYCDNVILPCIDPLEAKDKLVTLDGAMGKSQDSQQRIHDWDRKMGLKRSHSKTMRLSSRSRKKLRHFMQQDILHLSSHLS